MRTDRWTDDVFRRWLAILDLAEIRADRAAGHVPELGGEAGMVEWPGPEEAP